MPGMVHIEPIVGARALRRVSGGVHDVLLCEIEVRQRGRAERYWSAERSRMHVQKENGGILLCAALVFCESSQPPLGCTKRLQH